VDPTRIAGYGLSMGAHAFAQLSAEDLPLAALVLAGVPSDGDALTRNEFRAWGLLTQVPGLLADRYSGFDPAPTPLVALATSPRPILLLWGAKDEVVPTWMPAALARIGPGPRSALRLPEAGHGGYLDTDAEGFTRGLLEFLSHWIGI
jgi:pimeloyl-ACP methyl ester carboxylesterase